jgi:hypothetical protein
MSILFRNSLKWRAFPLEKLCTRRYILTINSSGNYTGCPKTREHLRTSIRRSDFRINAFQMEPNLIKWQKKQSSFLCLLISRSSFSSNWTLVSEPRAIRKMDQQSIVLYLHTKGLAAVTIHHDLVATLSAIHLEHNCDEAILLALNERPFTSIRQLARLTHRSRSAAHRYLIWSLGFQVRHLRWVSHRLSNTQKSN